MSRVSAWIASTGMRPEMVYRRVMGGIIIGLTVVAIDRVMGFGS